jgi:putative nucleotidyltransferase with HDIG domain
MISMDTSLLNSTQSQPQPTLRKFFERPFFNTLFGKLLLPVISFMLLSLLITGLVFNLGIQNTTGRILQQQLQGDSQNIITNLLGRLDIVDSTAVMLASNTDISASLQNLDNAALEVINSRALTVQSRFNLDLIQIYDRKGTARTNLVQSSLYKVTSVMSDYPEITSALVTLDGRMVYLAHQKVATGGDIYVGIDLESELSRIAFQLGLQYTPELNTEASESVYSQIKNSTYHLYSPLQIKGQNLTLEIQQNISQFEHITRSGQNIILLASFLSTLVLVFLMSILLKSITAPVQTLAKNTRQLAQADFDQDELAFSLPDAKFNPLHIGENDEIGQLQESFTKMALELKAIYQGLIRELRQTNDELKIAYDSALKGWSSALELRDHDTEKHTERTADDLISLARFMGIPENDLENYRRGALLHDVGKMAIPDEILRKNGPLTDQEWQIMRQHPIYAYVMLRNIPFLHDALEIPYCHHEKWDGTGYPRGLFRKEIPLSARIFTVIDVYDSMRSDRPYRKGMPDQQVLDYIASRSGKDFDPDVVKTFFKWYDLKNIIKREK